MSSLILIGTAGWSIPSRYRPDFPDGGSHLERYATRFNAVEINSSFYRSHRRITYERWAASVPMGFRFSVKLPRAISHERRLRDSRPLIESFADEVGGLGEKLGTILVQLPPSLAFDPKIADMFFDALRSTFDTPIACEPRHSSWFSDTAEALLQAHRIARVAADPAPVAGADQPGGWAGLLYLRLHGSPVIYRSPYGEARLRHYAAIIAAAPEGTISWCILDNTADMAAAGDALLLQRLMRRTGGRSGTPFPSDR